MSFAHRNQLLEALKLAARLSCDQHFQIGSAVLIRTVNMNDRRVWHLYFEANARCAQWADKEGAD